MTDNTKGLAVTQAKRLLFNRAPRSMDLDPDHIERVISWLNTAGQLASVGELKDLRAERDHAQGVAILAEKDRRSASFDAKRALRERDQARADLAALRDKVRALAGEWQGELDTGAICDECSRYCWGLATRELHALLDGSDDA